jgi:hypothetical protein
MPISGLWFHETAAERRRSAACFRRLIILLSSTWGSAALHPQALCYRLLRRLEKSVLRTSENATLHLFGEVCFDSRRRVKSTVWVFPK